MHRCLSVKISVKLGQLKYKVLTDEKWLCFAIEQILSNAIKYTNKGYILIDTENETTLVLVIRNWYFPEDLPRICEKDLQVIMEEPTKGLQVLDCILQNRY